jgi:hypothetical protein
MVSSSGVAGAAGDAIGDADAVGAAGVSGVFAELGVLSGASAAHAPRLTARRIAPPTAVVV